VAEDVRPASIVFEDGKILAIAEHEINATGSAVIDAGDDYVLPGLIDTHVHINQPGRTEWEGFRTATAAAAAAGVTCVVDMPLNSIPATTTAAALQEKRKSASGQSTVNYAFWGGVVPGNTDQLVPLAAAGVCGFKCFLVESGVPEFQSVTEADLEIAMPRIAETGLPLLVHAESPAQICAISPDGTRYGNYLRSRPQIAELDAIDCMIRLCRKHRCRVHIVHLSAATAIAELVKARMDGLPITVETCPHYLYFAAENIPDRATQFKCAPPIRDCANRELLWEGLRDGGIDLIATDHSPCPPELKNAGGGDFGKAWGGIASLSLPLPVIWTEASKRRFGIQDVVRWMSVNTARLAGLGNLKGQIRANYDADFAVFDPDAEFVVTPERLHFRHPVTPYLGERLKGEVKQTFVRGRRVFANGQVQEDGAGIEVSV
ncbi:MAG: allantoinase AllB, partial [Acidobacteriaceae bacterium]|nr:allantoinase AllB [Acidobacteriaceae bacterium]